VVKRDMYNKQSISYKFFSILIPVFILINCHSERKPHPFIVQPKLLSTKEPLAYPVEALNLGIEGKTVIRILVDTDGYITESTILESSGSHLLDESALKMVKSSLYEPGTIDGVPGIFELHIPMYFKLGNTYDLLNDIDEWLEQTLLYQEEIERATAESKSESYENLFFHYQEMAQEISYTRSKDVNNIILDIVAKSVSRDWREYRDKWPLGFLLYQDYIKRYPDSKYISNSLDGLIRHFEREKKILEYYTYSKPPYSTIYSQILNGLIKAYDQKHF
jgi:TonB family protein